MATDLAHVLHGFIVDFYCPSERIVLELEGNVQDAEAQRDCNRARAGFLEVVVRAQVEPQQSVNGVYAYQYVSHPARVAAQVSKEEAIVYVNTILRLVSVARRS